MQGIAVHWYDKPGLFFINSMNYQISFFSFSFLHYHNNCVEMRKQRKMGHITIVGSSVGIVEAQLKSMLKEEGSETQTAGRFSQHDLITVLNLCG